MVYECTIKEQCSEEMHEKKMVTGNRKEVPDFLTKEKERKKGKSASHCIVLETSN